VSSGKNYVTGQTGTPTDFLSFHAKGKPEFVDGHVRMGIATHLREADRGFTKVLSIPSLANKPVVIGESDPEGCTACPGPQNDYRNGTMYSSYTAASFARIWELAEKRKVNLEGVLSWSFEFEDQPWFAGYRQLSTNGVDLPVLNVFRLFAQLGETRLTTTNAAQIPLDQAMAKGIQGDADIGSIATRTADGKVALLLWHYHDDDVAGPTAQVKINLKGLKAAPTGAKLWRVDGDHANAFSAWKKMGSPQSPDQDQYAQLEAASVMKAETVAVSGARGASAIDLALPRQGVALLVLDAQ
jgi:xylan 1,4-beta-xylosidase